LAPKEGTLPSRIKGMWFVLGAQEITSGSGTIPRKKVFL
jgi:hypothetical protein